jgi:hypothetical protein
MNIDEKFKSDVEWILAELKQEELANAYSEYKMRFSLVQPSMENEPSLRSQRRILKMLEDRKVLTLNPFYHRTMSVLDNILQMQGAEPLGYYIKILQPDFDKLFEQTVNQKLPLAKPETEVVKLDPPTVSDFNKYFISTQGKNVLVNNTFILSTPRFDGENDRFIDCMISSPYKKWSKSELAKKFGQEKLKKSLHQILYDLGFKGEIRKLFFDVAKNSVMFRNDIAETELEKLGVHQKNLTRELSVLVRIDRKEMETDGNILKQ